MANSNEIAQLDAIYTKLNAVDSSLNTMAANYLKMIQILENGSKVIKDNTKSTEDLNKAQKATSDISKQKENIDKQLISTTEKLTAVENGSIKPLLEKKIALQAATKAQMDEIKAEGLAETSLVRMRQRLKELTDQYDKSEVRTKSSAAEINKLSREIGKAEEATNRHQRNVGNYSEAFGKFKGVIAELPGPLGSAMGAAEGLVTKLGSFGPVGLWVGGAIMSIGAPLAAFFLKSEKGVEMLERKFSGFKASISVLVGELIKSGDKMTESFDKPSKSPFWTAILSTFGPSMGALGARMDYAGQSAEKYTLQIQKMEDAERALIVPRAEANDKIKQAMLLYADSSKSLTVRIGGLKEAIKFENETADAEIAHQKLVVINIRSINKLKEDSGQLRDSDDKKLQEAIAREIELKTESAGRQIRAAKRIQTGTDEILKESEKSQKESFDKKIATIEILDKKEKELINKRHIDGITDEKGYQAELINQEIIFLNAKQALYKPDTKEYQDIELQKQAITIKSQDDILKAIADRFKQQKELEEQGTKDLEYLLKDQRTAEEKAADEAMKTGEKLLEDKKKLDDDYVKSKKEKDKDIRDASIDLARDSINAVFEMQNMKLEKEMSDLEKKKEKELSNKNLTEAQKLKIEADFDKKAGAIKTKQAQQSKIQALFDIAIGTAVSVMNAKGNLPLMIILAAMGAVQAALVAARPIPKYAKGTKSAEREGIFGEAGRELLFPVGGGAIMADKATYFEGDKFKGAKIYSNPETERLMSMVQDRNIIVKNQTDDRLLNEMVEVKKAIQNKKEWIMDSDYRIIGHKTSNHQEIILNRLLRKN